MAARRRVAGGTAVVAVLGCAAVLALTVWPAPLRVADAVAAGGPAAAVSAASPGAAARPPDAAAAGAPASPPTPVTSTPAASTPVADPAPVPWPAVGALFDGTLDDLGHHFCSAAVVDSPSGDVVVTAAHCLADGDGTPARTAVVFVPGYAHGAAPFGVWTVTGTAVDPRWIDGADPDLDVAFLTVARPGAGPVQALTGGYTLVTDPGAGDGVEAVGYPDDADAPVAPTGTTVRMSPTQLELAGPDLPAGTSGGPWLRDGRELVGVTGGFQEGGDTDRVSYASYLDADTTALLATLGAG